MFYLLNFKKTPLSIELRRFRWIPAELGMQCFRTQGPHPVVLSGWCVICAITHWCDLEVLAILAIRIYHLNPLYRYLLYYFYIIVLFMHHGCKTVNSSVIECTPPITSVTFHPPVFPISDCMLCFFWNVTWCMIISVNWVQKKLNNLDSSH